MAFRYNIPFPHIANDIVLDIFLQIMYCTALSAITHTSQRPHDNIRLETYSLVEHVVRLQFVNDAYVFVCGCARFLEHR